MTSDLSPSDRELFPEIFEAIDGSAVDIVYEARFREFLIRRRGQVAGLYQISFCPFSGRELPCSLRDLWYDIAEQEGWWGDDLVFRGVDEYKTDLWWRKRGL